MILGSWVAFRKPCSSIFSPKKTTPGLNLWQWLTIILVALVWTMLGGAGHFFYANYFDWHVRDALLLDLSKHTGPLAYQTVNNSVVWLLRCPLGYFLAPALVTWFVGLQYAQIALLAWTCVGVILFLGFIASANRGWRGVLLTLVIVPLFGGMDWLGGWLLAHNKPLFSVTHLQWWALLFQYSANSTQLFWVPNHAVPGWLFAAYIYTYWDDENVVRTAPWWITVMPLWSPLTAIGAIPFLIAHAFRHRRKKNEIRAALGVATLLILPALLCAAYLTMDSSRVPTGLTNYGLPFTLWLRIYAGFVLIEFGVLWLLLLRLRRDRLTLIAGAILLVLPVFRLGIANDLVMRASIVPLVILCIGVVDRLTKIEWHIKHQRNTALGLYLVLALGAITGLHEIARAILLPRWEPSHNTSTFVETAGVAHYFARLNNTVMIRTLAPATIYKDVRLPPESASSPQPNLDGR